MSAKMYTQHTWQVTAAGHYKKKMEDPSTIEFSDFMYPWNFYHLFPQNDEV